VVVRGILAGRANGAEGFDMAVGSPGGAEFGRIAREKGLKAALDWRDSPFGDYGSAPADASKPAGAAW
jgi:hypothetical protein